MSIQEAFEICTRLFLLCGIFAPVAMCAGLGWHEKPKRKITTTRRKSKQRPGKFNNVVKDVPNSRKAKAKKRPLSQSKGWFVAPELTPDQHIRNNLYQIKRDFVTI